MLSGKFLMFKHFDYSMIRWAVTGTATSIIDYVLFVLLYQPTNSIFLASFIAASVSTSINYFTHHRWSFRSNQNPYKSGFKYLFNVGFWWSVSTTIIQSLVILEIDPKIAKLVPLLFIAPINYFVLNSLVFKNHR
jgi:putative flippase GtrA